MYLIFNRLFIDPPIVQYVSRVYFNARSAPGLQKENGENYIIIYNFIFFFYR